MDNKQFNALLIKSLGIEAKECSEYCTALINIISDELESGNSIAIPAFGQFSPTKHDEEVITDLSNGKRMLLPPNVSIEFYPGSILLKHLRQNAK